jgi:hypothetical protein
MPGIESREFGQQILAAAWVQERFDHHVPERARLGKLAAQVFHMVRYAAMEHAAIVILSGGVNPKPKVAS